MRLAAEPPESGDQAAAGDTAVPFSARPGGGR